MPENGKEYSMEVVERAEDLHCVDGHTLDQVATITGVSVPTLKRWSVQYDWATKRDNIRRARSAIRTNRVLLHAALIENALKSLNPMDAFAVSSIEGVVQRAAASAMKGQVAQDQAADNYREIRTEADAVAALEEALEIRINKLLSNPDGLNFGSMQDITKALELLNKLKARQPAATGKTQPGLSEEAAETIRKQILGIK